MNKKRGLGKGIDALFSDPPQSESGARKEEALVGSKFASTIVSGRTIVSIPIDKIIPNKRQPRLYFDQEKLQELSDSIKEHGVAEPVIVRPAENGTFELIAGERRWRASQLAKKEDLPAIVKSYSDEQALEIAIVENIQREDLSPLEEGEAYLALQKEFGLTQEDVAKKVGKSRSVVANTVRLLDLSNEIKESLLKSEISAGHARALLSIENESARKGAWEKIITDNVTVREIEALASGNKKGDSSLKEKKSLPLELAELEDLLASYFGTKVKVSGKADKGKIEIQYFSREDIERIIELLIKK